ncbi:LacI family DNA-binding transcriptional regulator [Ktedonobacter robiniae]|uniref:LacI family transcriptional regulator n=1 Tax=Ktedonobacter robiniae TaxID=2778365 RepID=A0ABQ3UWZ9_9CHLR|nr:LacI family DNA-binding transcriptional regulator [Ktedonobacter robiniae]GHO57092.1 LacI family transcriptional regulator [Ktedonobacter robiniae]
MTTIADVARRAKVTTATVSNVLTQRVPVSDKTRARVLQAIKELGYRPNLVARGLAQGKTLTLALVVPTLSNPFFAEVVEEIEHVADLHDYQLLLSMTHNSPEEGKRHLERMASRWVDGFIVMGMAADIADVLSLRDSGKEVVLSVWNQDASTQTLPIVDIDFRLAGELATRHLLECGHRRIAAIVEEPVQLTRRKGFEITLTEAGIPVLPEYIRQGDSSFESGYQAALALLALPQPPTAIFAGNDWMALGAMEAIANRNLSIPHDLSVVGVDDISQAAHSHPALTTISIPKREMARAATELLLRYIQGTDIPTEPLKILVSPHLKVRQSTARINSAL